VVWGARIVGVPIRERTAGVDLLPALVGRAAAEGWRVCLFGAAPGVAERAAGILGDQVPDATVVGMAAPAVAADGTMDPEALDAIKAVRPDIIGVALGNPKQERWIARHGAATGAAVLIGIGGTLDFLTGVTQRAPHWMQRWGLEWIHRAVSEPRRLAARYAKDVVVFGPALARQAWTGRRRSSAVVPFVERDGGGLVAIRLMGPAPRSLLDGPPVAADDSIHAITVDASALDRLDVVTVAALVGLTRRARRVGAACAVRGLTPAARRDAYRLGVGGLLDRSV
jgi:N-acetylglucosaminyldiphosphoundecaprenol N-acetyl-beta-D-mannosaminyltransferase